MEQEHGSQGLFDLFKLLRPPVEFRTEIDAQLFQQGREVWPIRVWQLLFTVDQNPSFRERIFSLAATPPDTRVPARICSIAWASKPCLSRYLKDDAPQAMLQRESRLVKLARQAWRLDHQPSGPRRSAAPYPADQ